MFYVLKNECYSLFWRKGIKKVKVRWNKVDNNIVQI